MSILVEGGLRSVDFFGRLSGETLVIIMPNTDIASSKDRTERIRVLFEQYTFVQGIRITTSLGLTEYKKGQEAEDLLKLADSALNEAKQSGLNRICVR
ncbi:MAG TPA: GGDEF domain-containing protein [Thiomicrospira sp.]|jgi:diguanylate cyclase (GGDEF)-like protein|nr:GGDEF domain-containing protein [Thiomicrospira sp.]